MVVDAVHHNVLIQAGIIAEHAGQHDPACLIEEELVRARKDQPVELMGPLALQKGIGLQPRRETPPLLLGVKQNTMLHPDRSDKGISNHPSGWICSTRQS